MSIHKIKNGYRTRWREAGRQCSKNFRLKSEAVQFLAETKAGTKNVVSLPLARTSGTGMTFSEFAPMWFRKYSSVHKAPSTQIRDHQSNVGTLPAYVAG